MISICCIPSYVRMNRSQIYIKRGEQLRESIAEIFKKFGFGDIAGKKVVVKPNMLRAATPDQGVVTDPRLLSETVLFLIDAGADVIVGDNSAPNRTSNEIEIARSCGFIEASHGRFRNISSHSRKVVQKDGLLKELYVSPDILDCDILVSLPKLKPHDLTMMTAAVKNHFGIIPGALKPHIHALFPRIDDFSRVLIEVYELRPPDIIIVDCLDVIDARGKRYTPGIIIGGDNGHAIDFVCAQMIDTDPYMIPTLKIAKNEGLFEPNNIEVIGEFRRLKGYSMPFRFPFRNSVVEVVARLLYRMWLARKPVIHLSKCTRCLRCEDVCPQDAIKDQTIDYKKCIKCYCCLEVCPDQAITTKFAL